MDGLSVIALSLLRVCVIGFSVRCSFQDLQQVASRADTTTAKATVDMGVTEAMAMTKVTATEATVVTIMVVEVTATVAGMVDTIKAMAMAMEVCAQKLYNVHWNNVSGKGNLW